MLNNELSLIDLDHVTGGMATGAGSDNRDVLLQQLRAVRGFNELQQSSSAGEPVNVNRPRRRFD